jgi:hypothetical protein
VNARSEPDSVRGIYMVGFMAVALAFSTPLFACQESCLIIETSNRSAVLEDFEGKALSHAEVIVRDAANGPSCRCGRFGPVVKRLRTDGGGHFKLNGLHPRDYWVTYMNRENGESFYIRLQEGRSSRGPLELQVDHFGGLCYLVDVERNATKPPTGWPKPRPTSNAQTH